MKARFSQCRAETPKCYPASQIPLFSQESSTHFIILALFLEYKRDLTLYATT